MIGSDNVLKYVSYGQSQNFLINDPKNVLLRRLTLMHKNKTINLTAIKIILIDKKLSYFMFKKLVFKSFFSWIISCTFK